MSAYSTPSPNFGYPQSTTGRSGQRPIAVIHHITQGSAAGAIAWFQNPASQVSAHYLVTRDGAVFQFVDEADAAWGNGALNHPDLSVSWIRELAVGKGVNPNLLTVSIEHEGMSGEPLAEPQIAASIQLTREICARWRITPDSDGLVGHNAIDSINRARCPGLSHPWQRIRQELNMSDTPLSAEASAKAFALLTAIWEEKDALRKSADALEAAIVELKKLLELTP